MIDIDVLITGSIGLVSTIMGSWTSWFFARKKYNSEVDNNLIHNMKESLDFYTKLSDDNRERLDSALERNTQLTQKVEELESQINNLMYNICVDLTCQLRKRDINLFDNNYKSYKNGTKNNQKV